MPNQNRYSKLCLNRIVIVAVEGLFYLSKHNSIEDDVIYLLVAVVECNPLHPPGK